MASLRDQCLKFKLQYISSSVTRKSLEDQISSHKETLKNLNESTDNLKKKI